MGSRLSFFEWVAKCCELLGWSKEEGIKLLPEADPSWYFCYDDGMTPEAAVNEYKQRVTGLH